MFLCIAESKILSPQRQENLPPTWSSLWYASCRSCGLAFNKAYCRTCLRFQFDLLFLEEGPLKYHVLDDFRTLTISNLIISLILVSLYCLMQPLSILCSSLRDIDTYTTGFPRGDGQGHANIFRAVKHCLPGPVSMFLNLTVIVAWGNLSMHFWHSTASIVALQCYVYSIWSSYSNIYFPMAVNLKYGHFDTISA